MLSYARKWFTEVHYVSPHSFVHAVKIMRIPCLFAPFEIVNLVVHTPPTMSLNVGHSEGWSLFSSLCGSFNKWVCGQGFCKDLRESIPWQVKPPGAALWQLRQPLGASSCASVLDLLAPRTVAPSLGSQLARPSSCALAGNLSSPLGFEGSRDGWNLVLINGTGVGDLLFLKEMANYRKQNKHSMRMEW